MGVFVNYKSNIFANLSDTPQTILTADTNTLLINSIIVCNRIGRDSLLNLQKLRSDDSSVTIFIANQFTIKAYETVDIAARLGLQIFLQFSSDPSISDSLIIFSNSYSQIFDCEISYTELLNT